jgi:hypothetical protein
MGISTRDSGRNGLGGFKPKMKKGRFRSPFSKQANRGDSSSVTTGWVEGRVHDYHGSPLPYVHWKSSVLMADLETGPRVGNLIR